jgi:hypothetical protein
VPVALTGRILVLPPTSVTVILAGGVKLAEPDRRDSPKMGFAALTVVDVVAAVVCPAAATTRLVLSVRTV